MRDKEYEIEGLGELLKEAILLLTLSAAATSIWQRKKKFMSHPTIVKILEELENEREKS